MILFDQHIVVDIADRKGAITSNEPDYLLHLLLRHRAEPGSRRLPVTLHRREKERDVPGRHIGQRVGPVFEDALVDALRLMQMRATIIGNSRPQDMMMAPLDDVDGVDLQIAQMLYGEKGRVPPGAKRRPLIEALGVKPDAPRLHFIERNGVARRLGHGVNLSRRRHETTTSFLGAGRPERSSVCKRPCMGADNRRPSAGCYATVFLRVSLGSGSAPMKKPVGAGLTP